VIRVKICGIRRREDALEAAALGADAIGFIFWPKSPRFIEPGEARAIVRALPAFVQTVGVFVDQPPDEVGGIAAELGLGAVQLHGDEAVASYAGLRCRVIKAVATADSDDLQQRTAAVPADATVLLDAHDPVHRGGTGRTIDWHAAGAVARARPVILSGGINAGNVARAIDTVRPYAVDVSSGVESAPGVKDSTRLRALFAAIPRI
jgi:phosphoribosylanthranilate isomerase